MADQQRYVGTFFDAAPRKIGAAVRACLLPGKGGGHLGCDRIERTAAFALFVVGVPMPGHRTPAAPAPA